MTRSLLTELETAQAGGGTSFETAAPYRGASSVELEEDIRFLNGLLDGTIRRLAGEEAFRLVADVRAAAQGLRAHPSVEAARQ